MPPPVKHHSKSKVGRRRSHLAMETRHVSACPSCGHPILPHRYCAQCGVYRERVIKASKLKIKK